MANNTANISTAQKGINFDLSSFNTDRETFTFCLNGSIEDMSGNFLLLQNMESNRLAINFGEFIVIGKTEIHEQNRVLYALLNPLTGNSEIGEVQDCIFDDDTDDLFGLKDCKTCTPTQIPDIPLEKITQTPYCTYRTIVSNICLGFNKNNPVEIEYRITDCGINVYFNDNLNDRRFLYFTYGENNELLLDDRFKTIIGFTEGDCPQPIYGDELDCNKISYNPAHSIPCVSSISQVSGGSLKAGVYQVLIAYSDVEGNPLGQYGAATQPFPIFTKYITVATDYSTDKALAIKIDGIDTSTLFGYFNLVIAQTIDNFTEFKFAGIFPVTKGAYVYTGDNQALPTLSSDEVLFKRPFYKTAGSITKSNNFLFFGNVTEFSKPNLQKAANNIILKWQTVAIPESVYRKPENSWRYRSCMRDEVYPYGIVFTTGHGEETCAYHIPGREAIESDLEIISNNDVLQDTSCNNITRTARWQVYNTASVEGTVHELTIDCEDTKCWETGSMAYWESIETYPNDPEVWGDLCGQPIRHHKFPDSCVTHIHDGIFVSSGTTKDFDDNNILYPIGVHIDHQSVIDALDQAVSASGFTQDERDKIIGYRIVRGNRVGNKSIVAKGLLYDMWHYNKFNQTHYYPNYPYNDLRPDSFISGDDDTYDEGNESDPNPLTFDKTDRYTFHSPDTHFVNPSLGTELHLETEEFGQAQGYFTEAQDEARYKLLSTFAMTFAFAAGVAAALSATEEKECTTYTVKSNYILEDLPYSDVNQSTYTLTAGSGVVPPISTSLGTATATETHNNSSFTPYGKVTGSTLGQIPVNVDSYTKTTCTGSPFQILSPLGGHAVALINVLNQSIYQIMLGLKEMEIMKDLMMTLIPWKNLAIQYNSIGKYNNYKCIAKSGNKIRKILTSAYLTPENQVINEDVLGDFKSVFINNWERESSVYLNIHSEIPFPNPTIIDTSRASMDDFGLDYGDLNKRVYSNISSYYGSLKNFVPDQYGDIYKIDYLETNGCVFSLDEDYDDCVHVFGGDTFINRFGLKRKLPFFIQSRFRTIDGGDVKYSELGNIGFPNYYFNINETILEKMEDEGVLGALLSIRDLVGASRSRLDAKTAKLFYQNGYIHLYSYGIPYFLVESDINVDYRHGEDQAAHDFFPHQSNLDFWLQEKNVSIKEDNYYTYNKTYSKQNHESIICIDQSTFDNRDCKMTHPNRVIYYDEANASKFGDNWIISKANNFHDFPLLLGKLISVDGMENDKVLARFENGVQIFNAYDTLKTGAGINIQLGTGGIFASRPEEFANTTLGYIGSQHKAILHTEFGHITVDAKRGQIFNILPNASSLDELSKENLSNWFKENLPFTLLKQYPSIDERFLDNTYNGVGLILTFDKRYKRFFLTKRDYKSLNRNVVWNKTAKRFELEDEEVLLTDKKYFCDKSWTVSYNFRTKDKRFIYHSFTPNYYIQHINYFQSGINGEESTLWSHGVTNKSYQVYYGKLYPFIVELNGDPSIQQNFIRNVNFDLEVFRYHNEYDQAINRAISFNKAIIFNERQCTGLLELIPKDEENLEDTGRYPEVTPNSIKIDITNSNNTWNFNQFWNNVSSQTHNVPIWLNDCNNVTKRLNPKAFDFYAGEETNALIRGQKSKIQLISDKESNYKFIFKYLINNQSQSIR